MPEIGLCGKDGKRSHVLTPSINQILTLTLLFLTFYMRGKMIIQNSRFALVAVLNVLFQLQWSFLNLGWFCLSTREKQITEFKNFTYPEKTNFQHLLFSNPIHQYHACKRWLAIGSTVYRSFKCISQQTLSEKLFPLMNFQK